MYSRFLVIIIDQTQLMHVGRAGGIIIIGKYCVLLEAADIWLNIYSSPKVASSSMIHAAQCLLVTAVMHELEGLGADGKKNVSVGDSPVGPGRAGGARGRVLTKGHA